MGLAVSSLQSDHEYEDNQQLLNKLGIKNIGNFFRQFFFPGCPARIERARLTAQEAITLVHDAGGICVLAHPGSSMCKNPERIPVSFAISQA